MVESCQACDKTVRWTILSGAVVEAQGGFLEIRNSEQTGGGEVTLWLKVAKHAIKQSGGLF